MKDRKMIKWQPFASLPEQANYINKLIYDLNKINRPSLSEDQLDDLNRKLCKYIKTREVVVIHYYYDGYVYLVEGIIIKFDQIKKQITIECNNKRDNFSVESIIKLELA